MMEAPPPYTSSTWTATNSAPSSNGDDPVILTPTESISSALPPYEPSTLPSQTSTTNFTPSPSTLSPAIYTPLTSPDTYAQPCSPFHRQMITELSSAAAYFEERQSSLQSYDEILTHIMVITPSSTPETIAFPPHGWLNRDVNYQDFATFLNYLLPHQIASPASPTSEKQHGSNEKCEALQPISDPERQANIAAVVAEWNEGFFNPRGLRVEAFSPTAPPRYSVPNDGAASHTAAGPSRFRTNEASMGNQDENATASQGSWFGVGALRQVMRFAEAARRNSEQLGQYAEQRGMAFGEAAEQRGLAFGRACEQWGEQVSRSATLAPGASCPRRKSVVPAEATVPEVPREPRLQPSHTMPETQCSKWSKPSRPSRPCKPSKPSKPRGRPVPFISSSPSTSSLESFPSSDVSSLSLPDLDNLTQRLAEIALREPVSNRNIAAALSEVHQHLHQRRERGYSRKYTKEEKQAAKRNFHNLKREFKQKRKEEQRKHKEALEAEKTRQREARYGEEIARYNEELTWAGEDYNAQNERYEIHEGLYTEQEQRQRSFEEHIQDWKRMMDEAKVGRKEAKNAKKQERKEIKKQIKEVKKELFYWDQ
ncbi:MAG: hypothetical protein M1836_001622 [Candelina mexicana]|nr:MAG: hypothetical protein M1836_001622 [Candelina mexicana]